APVTRRRRRRRRTAPSRARSPSTATRATTRARRCARRWAGKDAADRAAGWVSPAAEAWAEAGWAAVAAGWAEAAVAWEAGGVGADLVVERKMEEGRKVSETYSISPDGKQLSIIARMEGGRAPKPITILRVYDRVTGEAAAPAAATSPAGGEAPVAH